jgi:hypothetical protein
MMEPVDEIVFGDNQFFGINHMSADRAQRQAERFQDLASITEVYGYALDAGIRAMLLNTNERAAAICDWFRARKSSLPAISWYPSIPYPHKYANLIAERGILTALKEVLLQGNGASGTFGLITKGGLSLLTQDEIKAMQMLIDLEMRTFRGLDVKVIFLQNIVTDLMLGLGAVRVLEEYCAYIRSAYGVMPGLLTQNMPRLVSTLSEAGIDGVVICASFNKIGYLMSPDVESYVETARRNDPARYQLMAMSTLASGAIPAREAYEFINRQNVQSVVFGASSERNIRETVSLIDLERGRAGLEPAVLSPVGVGRNASGRLVSDPQ